MPKRNYELEKTILDFISKNPGLNRYMLSGMMQAAGVQYGRAYLSNKMLELVLSGGLIEKETADRRRLIFPIAAPTAGAPGAKV